MLTCIRFIPKRPLELAEGDRVTEAILLEREVMKPARTKQDKRLSDSVDRTQDDTCRKRQ